MTHNSTQMALSCRKDSVPLRLCVFIVVGRFIQSAAQSFFHIIDLNRSNGNKTRQMSKVQSET